jgi:hypothetical protein
LLKGGEGRKKTPGKKKTPDPQKLSGSHICKFETPYEINGELQKLRTKRSQSSGYAYHQITHVTEQ